FDGEGVGFSGVARRHGGCWWRCSRSALVEGTPGMIVEGAGAVERRSGAPGRSTSRAAGFPVWLVDKRAVGGAAAARRSSRARRDWLVEGGGAGERRGGAQSRATAGAAGFPVWLAKKRAVGGAAGARRSMRARREWLADGCGAAERRGGVPGRSTSRAAGFPVWLVDKRAVGGAAAARRSSRARRDWLVEGG